MAVLYTVLTVIGALIIGYLFGSFPSAIFIGKVFYGVDVRTQGSHNAGGTNVGRVIGKKAGIITIALDVFKTLIAIWLVFFILKLTPLVNYLVDDLPIEAIYYSTGIACAIGHSFPCFAGFKGGKAMAVFSGFVLATNWLFALLGVTFFYNLLLEKICFLSFYQWYFICFLSLYCTSICSRNEIWLLVVWSRVRDG